MSSVAFLEGSRPVTVETASDGGVTDGQQEGDEREK
jgi:hypothetical protein